MRELGWKDHLNSASGFATLVSIAADRVADPQTQAELRAVAKTVDAHIEKGVAKVTAELKYIDQG